MIYHLHHLHRHLSEGVKASDLHVYRVDTRTEGPQPLTFEALNVLPLK